MSPEPVIPRQQPAQLSLGRGRKIFVGKDVFGLGAILEVVSQRDLVDGLREAGHIDTAEAIILDPRRYKIVAQGHLEPVKLDLGVGGFIPRHTWFDCWVSSLDRLERVFDRGALA